MTKNSPASAGDIRDMGSILGLGRSTGGGQGNPLQDSCLENPHGQRNLEGYRPWGHKELDMTEQLTLPLFSAGLSTQLCPLLPCTLMALISRLWVPLVTSGSWLCSTCFSPQVMNGGCCKSLFTPFLLTKDH